MARDKDHDQFHKYACTKTNNDIISADRFRSGMFSTLLDSGQVADWTSGEKQPKKRTQLYLIQPKSQAWKIDSLICARTCL